MDEFYIGLISGTSADGIDAALVEFKNDKPNLVGHYYAEYNEEIRQRIFALYETGSDEITRLGQLDILLGQAFADAANQLLKINKMQAHHIKAIGSHGQTIRHYPKQQYTLQIGDPNLIAAKTRITTVADFRRRDMALGGQGAPLVPAFHNHVFSSSEYSRAILNIGGIANITLLPKEGAVIGWDTGPGNCLLDAYIQFHSQKPKDDLGQFAQTGKLHQPLLESMLQDPYFKHSEPKSTGREYFNLAWLKPHLEKFQNIAPADIQNTLLELTVRSIVHDIKKYFSEGDVFVCGGGVHNHYLMERLTEYAQPLTLKTTKDFGIDPDWVEAMAFAWLAKCTLEKKTSNLTSVTGASKTTILGGIYFSDIDDNNKNL